MSREAAPAVEARGLTRRYEDVVAVRDVALSISRHTIPSSEAAVRWWRREYLSAGSRSEPRLRPQCPVLQWGLLALVGLSQRSS